jgi:hypothetical protein
LFATDAPADVVDDPDQWLAAGLEARPLASAPDRR